MSTGPFPKILHIGDKQIESLFDGEVEITEKVDGSQLGFGKVNGRLFVRSKGQELDLDNPNQMFEKAVTYVKSIEDKLPDNFTFYGEYLQKPKHNTLAYDRTPTNGIALFGVYNYITKEFLGSDEITRYAGLLNVDRVPVIHIGKSSPGEVLEMVNQRVSYLGGQKIEGVVVKAYKNWEYLGQIPLSVMSGKYVTEEFKEVHIKNWKAENTGKGRLEVAVSQYKSEARWNKAIQHLRDSGEFTGTPKDIGNLIKEIKNDVIAEEKENIKDQLWDIYGEQFTRAATDGFPQWFKEKLVLGELINKEKPVVRLENWQESDMFIGSLNGDAYGHPRFEDGTKVTTSHVDLDKQKLYEEGDRVETQNTIYVLGKKAVYESVN